MNYLGDSQSEPHINHDNNIMTITLDLYCGLWRLFSVVAVKVKLETKNMHVHVTEA